MAKRQKKTEEITFQSLSKNVQKALILLHSNRKDAIRGVFYHHSESCPIAQAYLVKALVWSELSDSDKELLILAGWNSRAYTAFMRWHDCENYDSFIKQIKIMGERGRFLREFLQRKTCPRIAA